MPHEAELDAIGDRYASTARELLEGDALVGILDAWSKDAEDVKDVLKAVALVKSAPQRSRDVVAGYGEIWSARLCWRHCLARKTQSAAEPGSMLATVVTVHETELGPTVLWDESQAKFGKVVPADFDGIAVITGFIASDQEGCRQPWVAMAATIRPRYSRHSAKRRS